jgi:hypothetical protein
VSQDRKRALPESYFACHAKLQKLGQKRIVKEQNKAKQSKSKANVKGSKL